MNRNDPRSRTCWTIASGNRALILASAPFAALLISAPTSAQTTERVSVDSSGAEGNANSGSSRFTISADGLVVAFESYASNLVAGDTNGSLDAFVHDQSTGITERVSVGSSGAESNGPSITPCISADGRFVAFNSWASNLVAGDTNGS